MAREGELSLNYRETISTVITQLQCNSSRGWKQPALHRRAHPAVQQRRSVLWRQTYKDKAFDLKLRLWEESYCCRKWRLVRGISAVRGCLMRISCCQQSLGAVRFYTRPGLGYLGTSGNVKNPLCSASDKYCIAITATNRRDLSTAARCSTAGLTVWRRGIPDALATAASELEYEGNNYQQDFAGKLEQKRSLTSGRFIALPIGPTLTLARTWQHFYVWRHAAHQL